jgi:hypothetical protein
MLRLERLLDYGVHRVPRSRHGWRIVTLKVINLENGKVAIVRHWSRAVEVYL